MRHRDWDETRQIPVYTPSQPVENDQTTHMELTEDDRTELIRLVDDGVPGQEHGSTHVPWWVLAIFTVGCVGSVALVVGCSWALFKILSWVF